MFDKNDDGGVYVGDDTQIYENDKCTTSVTNMEQDRDARNSS